MIVPRQSLLASQILPTSTYLPSQTYITTTPTVRRYSYLPSETYVSSANVAPRYSTILSPSYSVEPTLPLVSSGLTTYSTLPATTYSPYSTLPRYSSYSTLPLYTTDYPTTTSYIPAERYSLPYSTYTTRYPEYYTSSPAYYPSSSIYSPAYYPSTSIYSPAIYDSPVYAPVTYDPYYTRRSLYPSYSPSLVQRIYYTITDINNYARNLFFKYDFNRSGALNYFELKNLLDEFMAITGQRSLTSSEVASLKDIFDYDRSGSIDFPEFEMMLYHLAGHYVFTPDLVRRYRGNRVVYRDNWRALFGL